MEWEWEFYSRRPKALSYPFNLAGHCYWEKNSQVLMVHVIWCHIWYHTQIYDIIVIHNIIYDVLLYTGLCGVTGPLPQQSVVRSMGSNVLKYLSKFEPIDLTPDRVMQADAAWQCHAGWSAGVSFHALWLGQQPETASKSTSALFQTCWGTTLILLHWCFISSNSMSSWRHNLHYFITNLHSVSGNQEPHEKVLPACEYFCCRTQMLGHKVIACLWVFHFYYYKYYIH